MLGIKLKKKKDMCFKNKGLALNPRSGLSPKCLFLKKKFALTDFFAVL